VQQEVIVANGAPPTAVEHLHPAARVRTTRQAYLIYTATERQLVARFSHLGSPLQVPPSSTPSSQRSVDHLSSHCLFLSRVDRHSKWWSCRARALIVLPTPLPLPITTSRLVWSVGLPRHMILQHPKTKNKHQATPLEPCLPPILDELKAALRGSCTSTVYSGLPRCTPHPRPPREHSH
jgi:hypothetical protein